MPIVSLVGVGWGGPGRQLNSVASGRFFGQYRAGGQEKDLGSSCGTLGCLSFEPQFPYLQNGNSIITTMLLLHC